MLSSFGEGNRVYENIDQVYVFSFKNNASARRIPKIRIRIEFKVCLYLYFVALDRLKAR